MAERSIVIFLLRNQIDINEFRESLQHPTSAPLQALSMILLSSVAMESSSNKPARDDVACVTEMFKTQTEATFHFSFPFLFPFPSPPTVISAPLYFYAATISLYILCY